MYSGITINFLITFFSTLGPKGVSHHFPNFRISHTDWNAEYYEKAEQLFFLRILEVIDVVIAESYNDQIYIFEQLGKNYRIIFIWCASTPLSNSIPLKIIFKEWKQVDAFELVLIVLDIVYSSVF